ncbi:MAG TPA: CHRD domain-containing protein [Solirubrobacteraceae bacterium]|nr:CHRD domain-containing protein [Solirubrobacteraceae bacterium]
MNRTRTTIAFCTAIAAVAGLTSVSFGAASSTKLYSTMTGKAEKPAGDPDGSGVATLTLTSKRVCYSITVKKAGTTFAAGHIHTGARGKTGDPIIPLFSTSKKVKAGKLTGCATAKAADINKVKAKPANYYVNIHNAAFAPGALRGQLTKNKPS